MNRKSWSPEQVGEKIIWVFGILGDPGSKTRAKRGEEREEAMEEGGFLIPT